VAKFKIEWSVDARLDLMDILEFYFKQNGTVTYSIKLNSEINKSIRLLSKNPSLGILTNYDSVRTFIKGDYQIIYEIFDQLILIVMIWDSWRNPKDKVVGNRIK